MFKLNTLLDKDLLDTNFLGTKFRYHIFIFVNSVQFLPAICTNLLDIKSVRSSTSFVKISKFHRIILTFRFWLNIVQLFKFDKFWSIISNFVELLWIMSNFDELWTNYVQTMSNCDELCPTLANCTGFCSFCEIGKWAVWNCLCWTFVN